MVTKKRNTFAIMWILIVLVQLVTAVYFCMQKKGFHEDEFYTYYSTARTNGFFVENGKWMDKETYYNEFVVVPGQGFRYGLVTQVQSWDVHPPVYYWIFHTIDSFFAGKFSKWIGLSVNLIFYVLNLLLLTYLSYLISGRNEMPALLVTWFYGLTPAALSGVVFIRMYEVLCFFVLLCSVLHAREIVRLEENRIPNITKDAKQAGAAGCAGHLSVRAFLLPVTIVTYLGFLTQYYYFVFLFFLGGGFCLYLLWRDKNLRNCIYYVFGQLIAFVLAYLTYPAWPGQMFHGQRGAQATGNFFDFSNTLDRLSFYYDLLERYVFGGLLTILLIAVVLLFLNSNYRRATQGRRYRIDSHGILILIFAFTVVGYFFVVSKTALLLGETSVRYQLPVYGVIVLLIFIAVNRLAKPFFSKANQKYVWAFAAIICLGVNVYGWSQGRVVFLYPEAEEKLEFARKEAKLNTPVVYFYNEGEEWCIWGVADELFAHKKVYFRSSSDTGIIEDDLIEDADRLIVYVAAGADDEKQLGRITECNGKLTGQELMFEEKYCNVYLVDESD